MQEGPSFEKLCIDLSTQSFDLFNDTIFIKAPLLVCSKNYKPAHAHFHPQKSNAYRF